MLYLETPDTLKAVEHALQSIGRPAESIAWTYLVNVGDSESSLEQLRILKKETGLQGDQLERLLIWHACRQSLPRVASLAVHQSVREKLDQDLRQLPALRETMMVGSYHFNRAAKMATLRRFPAGPMEWELSGIPRSYFLKAAFPANLSFLAFVAFRLGARSPCFFMHVAPNPRQRALSVPGQVLRAYYRIARSLQLQPNVRALVAHAWFHDPRAVRDYPHLEVLSQPYLKEGGMIVLLGTAPPSSGVLEGNAQRKAEYVAGRIQYRYGLAMWPRDAAIRWAEAHPELE